MTAAGTSSDPGNNGPGRPTKLISTIRMAATVIGIGRECMSYSSSFIRIVTSHDAIRRGQAQLQRIIHELPRRGLLGKLGFRLTEFSEIYSRLPSLLESATSPRTSSSPVNACCRLLPQLKDTAHA